MNNNYDFEAAKLKWRAICNSKEYYMPIYHKDWYWDTVCDSPEQWRVILFENKDVIAAFPFCYKKIHGMWRIENPWQVARGGIWVSYFSNSISLEKKSRLSDEIVDFVVKNLPRYDYFRVNFLPEYTDCQSFYWHGFDIRVNYNHYILNRNIDDIKTLCTKKRRQRINTANKHYIMRVDAISVDDYWDFFKKSFGKRGRELSFEKERFVKLLSVLKENNNVQIRSAYSGEELVAIAIYLEDDKCLYHQFCANVPGNNDAQTLLTYNAIVDAMNKEKKFDFEGSMIKGVAEYNLSYCPEIEICYLISAESKKYKILNAIKLFIKK